MSQESGESWLDDAVCEVCGTKLLNHVFVSCNYASPSHLIGRHQCCMAAPDCNLEPIGNKDEYGEPYPDNAWITRDFFCSTCTRLNRVIGDVKERLELLKQTRNALKPTEIAAERAAAAAALLEQRQQYPAQRYDTRLDVRARPARPPKALLGPRSAAQLRDMRDDDESEDNDSDGDAPYQMEQEEELLATAAGQRQRDGQRGHRAPRKRRVHASSSEEDEGGPAGSDQQQRQQHGVKRQKRPAAAGTAVQRHAPQGRSASESEEADEMVDLTGAGGRPAATQQQQQQGHGDPRLQQQSQAPARPAPGAGPLVSRGAAATGGAGLLPADRPLRGGGAGRGRGAGGRGAGSSKPRDFEARLQQRQRKGGEGGSRGGGGGGAFGTCWTGQGIKPLPLPPSDAPRAAPHTMRAGNKQRQQQQFDYYGSGSFAPPAAGETRDTPASPRAGAKDSRGGVSSDVRKGRAGITALLGKAPEPPPLLSPATDQDQHRQQQLQQLELKKELQRPVNAAVLTAEVPLQKELVLEVWSGAPDHQFLWEEAVHVTRAGAAVAVASSVKSVTWYDSLVKALEQMTRLKGVVLELEEYPELGEVLRGGASYPVAHYWPHTEHATSECRMGTGRQVLCCTYTSPQLLHDVSSTQQRGLLQQRFHDRPLLLLPIATTSSAPAAAARDGGGGGGAAAADVAFWELRWPNTRQQLEQLQGLLQRVAPEFSSSVPYSSVAGDASGNHQQQLEQQQEAEQELEEGELCEADMAVAAAAGHAPDADAAQLPGQHRGRGGAGLIPQVAAGEGVAGAVKAYAPKPRISDANDNASPRIGAYHGETDAPSSQQHQQQQQQQRQASPNYELVSLEPLPPPPPPPPQQQQQRQAVAARELVSSEQQQQQPHAHTSAPDERRRLQQPVPPASQSTPPFKLPSHPSHLDSPASPVVTTNSMVATIPWQVPAVLRIPVSRSSSSSGEAPQAPLEALREDEALWLPWPEAGSLSQAAQKRLASLQQGARAAAAGGEGAVEAAAATAATPAAAAGGGDQGGPGICGAEPARQPQRVSGSSSSGDHRPKQQKRVSGGDAARAQQRTTAAAAAADPCPLRQRQRQHPQQLEGQHRWRQEQQQQQQPAVQPPAQQNGGGQVDLQQLLEQKVKETIDARIAAGLIPAAGRSAALAAALAAGCKELENFTRGAQQQQQAQTGEQDG